MRDKVRKDLLATYVQHGIEDEEDLDFCIQEFTGIQIPKQSYCPNHVSPFKFIADLFFCRSLFAFAFGSRGSGKTLLLELHNFLKMMFKQAPVEALVAAAARDQADRGYSYFTGFFRNEPILTRYLAGDPQKAMTRLINGSSLQIVYGTKKGLNGPHTNVVSIDEVELIELPVLEEGLAISISKNGIPAQDILGSTRKTNSGTVSVLLEEAEEKHLDIYPFCLSGETLIRSPQGDTRIRDLVGKEIYVYSVDRNQDNALVLKKAKNIRKTRKHTEVFEIVYEWTVGRRRKKSYSSSLVATPDHRIMLQDGTYKKVEDLRIGDSLMPFLKGKQPFKGKNRGWYVGFGPGVDAGEREHRFVWEQLHGELPPGYVVHHKDGNDYNNSPDNLHAMLRAKHSKNHTLRWHRIASEEKKAARNKKISEDKKINNPMFNPEWKAKMVAVRHPNSPLRHVDGVNHKVTAIYQHGYEDVYCLEVEDTHNFAANDIFVHNCIWENVEKCTRKCFGDKDFGDCPIYDKCKGKAHEGTGWYSIDDLIKKASNLTKSMFSTQFENDDPSGEVKVYGESYDENIHVISWISGGRFKSFQDIFQLKEIPISWRRVGGMDFGAHFAFGQYAIEPRYGIWIKEFEYYFHGDRLMARHAKEILELQSHYMKISVNALKRRRMPIYSDPSGKQEILEMRVYGLNCINAMNDLALGVDAVKKKLEVSHINQLPGYFILDTCVETRREYKTWSHPTMSDGKPDLDAYEDGNDHCFVAGTLIETDRGAVRVEDIKEQDLILTREGYRRIAHIWENNATTVYGVMFSDGRSLVGTGNHPIMIEGIGWLRLDRVRYGDIIVRLNTHNGDVQWQNQSLLSTVESSIAVIQNQKITLTDAIIDLMQVTSKLVSNLYIAKNGLTDTDKSLKVMMFIIKMAIRTIINCRIWNAYRKKIMQIFTSSICQRSVGKLFAHILPKSGHLQKHGMDLKMGELGTLNMERWWWRMPGRSLLNVKNAVMNFQFQNLITKPDFALQIVNQKQDDQAASTMRLENVCDVGSLIPVTNTTSASSVPVSVVDVKKYRGDVKVYNLTVFETHEYFANGILVHNCLDTDRYSIFSHNRMPKSHVKPITVAGI